MEFRQAAPRTLDEATVNGDSCVVNVKNIQSRLKERFRPFSVVTSSGNKYPVPHPDFIFLTSRTVVVADQEGYAVLLDPAHIVGLEDIPARKNGHRKRR